MNEDSILVKKHIIAPQACTGCGLCANVCKHGAIEMVLNHDGFLQPKVNSSICVNCGLCVKQCIALERNDKELGNKELTVDAYGAWNRDDDILLSSSSGGIFSALAHRVIEQGGIVFGVIWKDKLTASFSYADKIEDLAKMRGSKYVQALPLYVYRAVRRELLAGRLVLFSGTPCQVYALKKYLRKPYGNLLTIDIVCHGVPSHLLLKSYIFSKESMMGKQIGYVSFRDKPEGWQRYHVTCHYHDGALTSSAQQEDEYMNIFLSDKALNLACYNCSYASFPRQGDITVADYWGSEKHHYDWPVDKGISAVIVNSAKGKAVLGLCTTIVDFRPEDIKKIIEGQSAGFIRKNVLVPTERSKVLQLLRTRSLKYVHDWTCKRGKIGPFRPRYGSLLFKALRFLQRVKSWLRNRVLS